MAEYPSYGIMMCGHTTPQVEERWGDYGDMAQRLLSDPDRQEEWKKYNVCDGEFPTDDEFSNFKAVVITGSKHDAFAADPWIVKLRELMKREAQRGQRILGICFGCQLLAHALGGKAGRGTCGWESGSRPLTLLPAFFQQRFSRSLTESWKLTVHETHRDQVLDLPPHSELLATSASTPIEIWKWRDNVLAVQGHPEFTVAFQHALNQYRVDIGTMRAEEKIEAEAWMQRHPVTPQNAEELATALKHFLKD